MTGAFIILHRKIYLKKEMCQRDLNIHCNHVWRNGQINHGERVLAPQIPEEVFNQMTTDELVTTVLNYPCFIDMIFYDIYQEEFEIVRDNFNCLQILLNSENSGNYPYFFIPLFVKFYGG